ncbi:MAG: hypothetical protein JWR77_557 [Rhizorhabdus sp.]|nr:hypothetical protein [Rhizorhabdus sp.]
MPESSGNTQIVVAVIGVTGVIAAALFGNWEKIFPPQAAPPPIVKDRDAAPVPQPAVATPAAVDLNGRWHDGDGFVYVIDQQRDRFGYQQFSNGVQQGSGQGTLDGSVLRYTYLSAGGAGACQARVDPTGATIAGTCSSGGVSWGFTIVRG